MLNQVPCQAKEPVSVGVTVVCPNPASFDYFMGEKSPLAFAIFPGLYQESAHAHHIMSGIVWLQSCLFGAWQPPEPAIRHSHSVYLSHRCSQLRPPIPVAWIRQASSDSANNSPCGAVLFWRVCPSPSQVHHHHSARRTLYHLDNLACDPHPAHHWKLQDSSDCHR